MSLLDRRLVVRPFGLRGVQGVRGHWVLEVGAPEEEAEVAVFTPEGVTNLVQSFDKERCVLPPMPELEPEERIEVLHRALELNEHLVENKHAMKAHAAAGTLPNLSEGNALDTIFTALRKADPKFDFTQVIEFSGEPEAPATKLSAEELEEFPLPPPPPPQRQGLPAIGLSQAFVKPKDAPDKADIDRARDEVVEGLGLKPNKNT